MTELFNVYMTVAACRQSIGERHRANTSLWVVFAGQRRFSHHCAWYSDLIQPKYCGLGMLALNESAGVQRKSSAVLGQMQAALCGPAGAQK